MHGRRWTAVAMTIGLAVAGAGCSSSDGDATAASTTAAAPAATGTPTTTVALSPAARTAAEGLAERGGFSAGQSACMVDVLVKRLGETEGLVIIGDEAPPELSTAQQDALEASFTSCLSADDLGGLVGVAVQGLASDVGETVTEEQAVCAGKALIEAHTLRGLLFDDGLLDRVFSDTGALTTLLATCVPSLAAGAIAAGAARSSQDVTAQTAVRDAFTAAKTLASTADTFAGLTQEPLEGSGPDLTFVPDAGPSTGPTVVSWRLAGTTLYLAVRSESGTCWLVRDDLDDVAKVDGRIFGKVAPAGTGPPAPCTAAAVPDAQFTAAW